MIGDSGRKIVSNACLPLVMSTCIIVSVVSLKCPKDEYPLEDECCPACGPGKRVSKDCSEEHKIITLCVPCGEHTFQSGFNVRKECDRCTDCSPVLGLKVKNRCTDTADAICKPMDGYFCTDATGLGCMATQRHKKCSPGQYISRRGSAAKDRECLSCPVGTFSDGSSTYCHAIKMDSLGPKQMQPVSDSPISAGWIMALLLIGLLTTLFAISFLMLCMYVYIKCHNCFY